MKKKQVLLVTSLGSNTAISVVKAVRKTKEDVVIIGTDTNVRSFCAGAALVDQFYQVQATGHVEEYQRTLMEIVAKNKVTCLIPIHDLEISAISLFIDALRKITFVACNDAGIIEICNSKQKSSSFAALVGMKVPKIYSDLSLCNYPLIAKRDDGVGSKGQYIVRNHDELKEIFSAQQQKQYIVQEFVEGGQEYTIDCYSNYSGKFLAGVPRKRVEVRDGICTKGEVEKNDTLIGLCEKFLNKMAYKGASNLQFIRKNDEYYFIEINPRFSSTVIFPVEAGLNSPHYTLRESRGETILPSEINIRYNLRMARYWQESFYEF